MSYSRWSNSRWYTYHNCSGGDTYDSQEFSINDVLGGTINLTTDYLEKISDEQLKILLKSDRSRYREPTSEEIKELQGYIKEWLDDMKLEF
jgi:hypothetical protein